MLNYCKCATAPLDWNKNWHPAYRDKSFTLDDSETSRKATVDKHSKVMLLHEQNIFFLLNQNITVSKDDGH